MASTPDCLEYKSWLTLPNHALVQKVIIEFIWESLNRCIRFSIKDVEIKPLTFTLNGKSSLNDIERNVALIRVAKFYFICCF